MPIFSSYAALAASAFTSATILPGTSEAAFAAFLYVHPAHAFGGWLCAGIANGLGSMVSYGMGRVLPAQKNPLPPARQKAVAALQRYGAWTLLLAWVPFVGDALPIAAGWLRLNPFTCALMLLAGKLLRYGVIWWGFSWI